MTEATGPQPLKPPAPRGALRQAAALIAVSVLTAVFAIAFRSAAAFAYQHLFGAGDVVSSFERLPRGLRIATVAGGAALAGAVGLFASRYGGGTGVGGVMEAVALGTGRISVRASLWKALGCWLAIITGSSVGREGPLIQMGGALGGAIGLRGGLSADRARVLIAAGTAAGFAAAYNTPLAAILFVLEVVTSVITIDVVLASAFGAAISTAITRSFAGGGPIYGQRMFMLGAGAEIGLYLLIGALAGLVGTGFSVALLRSEHLFARFRTRVPATQLAGGLLVGAMAMALPAVTGNGYEAINSILAGKLALGAMLVLLVAKALATTTSVGSGIPGGAFTPSLFLGAALGGTLGDVWMHLSGDTHAAGACALLGMAAVCAATTHAPLMAAVLVFELSGDYDIVVPLLVATATATLVARRLKKSSIYMDEIERRGLGWEMTWAGRQMRDPPSEPR